VSHCRVLPLGEFTVTVPEPHATLQGKKKVKERTVLSEILLRTTGRHLSVGSHNVIYHPTDVTDPP